MDDIQTTAANPATSNNAEMQGDILDLQLVKDIADRVYALMLRDLRIEKERLIMNKSNSSYRYGGRP